MMKMEVTDQSRVPTVEEILKMNFYKKLNYFRHFWSVVASIVKLNMCKFPGEFLGHQLIQNGSRILTLNPGCARTSLKVATLWVTLSNVISDVIWASKRVKTTQK